MLILTRFYLVTKGKGDYWCLWKQIWKERNVASPFAAHLYIWKFWHLSAFNLVPPGIKRVDACILVAEQVGPNSSGGTGIGK